MNSVLKKDKEFKEAVGEFIIAFSELEHGLAGLCALAGEPEQFNDDLLQFTGSPFKEKASIYGDRLKDKYPEISIIWQSIKNEIDEVNEFRRFLTHGIYLYRISDKVPSYLRQGKKKTGYKFNHKDLTVSEIKEYANKLHHLNTGKYGVNGELWLSLLKARNERYNLESTVE